MAGADSSEINSALALASSRQMAMRSVGTSASNGSQAAPVKVMASWQMSSSSPRGSHRPTMSPGRTPAKIRRCAARSAAAFSAP